MRFLRSRRERPATRGQALVEFAIVLPILALLLVMAIDFGRVFFGWVGLQNGARGAADFASRVALSWPADRDAYRDFVIYDMSAINCAPPPGTDLDGDGTWDPADVPDPIFQDVDGNGLTEDDGDHARVELDCRFSLITPLAGAIVGDPVSLSGEAWFPINNVLIPAVPTPRPTPPGPCPGPTASFDLLEDPANGTSATDGQGRGSMSVDFTDTSTDDPDCPITTWEWDFQSDGTVDSTEQDPDDIAFTHPGTGPRFRNFVVELTVTTADGLTDTVTETIRMERP